MNDFVSQENAEKYPLTIGGVIRYVKDEYGLAVSKSSVCSVRDKCGADAIGMGAAKEVPELKSEKERAVYEAFKALGIA